MPIYTSFRRLLFVVALLAVVPVAEAGEDVAKEDAKKHFTKGMGYYTLEKYDEAIKEFEEGFLTFPDPAFLYNLGQCYRLSDRPLQAMGMFKKYLRVEPRAKQRAEVERRMGVLQKTIEELALKKKAAPPPDHTPDAPAEKPVVASNTTSTTSKPTPVAATTTTKDPKTPVAATTTSTTKDPKDTKDPGKSGKDPKTPATTTTSTTVASTAPTTTTPTATTTAPPPSAPVVKPRNVHPNALDGQVISRTNPRLPSAAKILHEGGDEEAFTAKVCVDKEGKVFHVGVIKGIIAADDEIVGTIKSWRYKPQPIAVCFIANWVFSFKA